MYILNQHHWLSLSITYFVPNGKETTYTHTRTKQNVQSNNTVKNKHRECWQTMIGYNRGSSSREAYGTLYSTLPFPNQCSVFTKCIPWYTQHSVDLSRMSQLPQRTQQSK
ncbi:uncharacterized protein TM35_001341030 [Trypanosoma theileri]|uniref:Uncharacterized protein n=1 Tax=Trypanosoma theileri TaxID=67003 RepID=A0A1X0NE57_9TRYP|nr:uncharacterized protein TM35_001341030 [Trypanosoma theileri]ORC81011.1 hypothetical protein TM35_001341030 [Trypanosoma theileri]